MDALLSNIPGLILAWSILMVGLFSPGPNILAVIGTSMARGRSQGAALAFGIGLGSGLWATLTVLGLSALLAAYAGALTILKIVGAAYLLWLAFKAFKSAASAADPATIPAARDLSGTQFLLRGLAIQMTNPKAALHWIAIVALGIGAEAPAIVGLVLILGATLISITGHLIYAALFSTSAVVQTYARARRWIEGALGLFFCFASYKLLTART